jgi:HPt (histidine-containing phosphotransfer) domain-containing protein
MDLKILRKMLIDNMTGKIKLIQKAIKENDFETIGGLGHQIKGNPGALALDHTIINDLGKELEAATKEKETAKIQEILEKLKKELETI